jgi:hypothetical protein
VLRPLRLAGVLDQLDVEPDVAAVPPLAGSMTHA